MTVYEGSGGGVGIGTLGQGGRGGGYIWIQSSLLKLFEGSITCSDGMNATEG